MGEAVRYIAQAIDTQNGREAVALRVAEQYLQSFGNIAKEGNTLLLPANCGDAGSMIAQAMAIYNNIAPPQKQVGASGSSSDSSLNSHAMAQVMQGNLGST